MQAKQLYDYLIKTAKANANNYSNSSATGAPAKINTTTLNYEEVANESNNKILIHASEGDETAWFVLKTNGEVISDVAGGTYEEIEDNVWLIGMEESSILITLKPSNTLFYYE